MRLILSLWLLATSLALAAEADRGELFLQRQRYASEALQLPLANGQMTVLKRPATATAIKGHALLFADIGSDPERSPRIRTLRHSLNELGWHSWAVVPPPQPQRAPWISPPRTANPAPASDAGATTSPATINPESADEWLASTDSAQALQQLREQLAAQLTRLREETDEGFVIIIAEGMSAPLLAEVLAAGDGGKIDALIVLGPYLPLAKLNLAVGDTLAAVQVPLLDLVMAEDHPLARHSSDGRRTAAKLRYLPHYRQRQLALASSNDSSAVSDEVKAFLRYLGW